MRLLVVISGHNPTKLIKSEFHQMEILKVGFFPVQNERESFYETFEDGSIATL